MSALPPALASWALQLSIFPESVAHAIGPWLPRLAAALGSRAQRDADGGDIEGFDGIDRLGTFERLLLSEWLYADELPDEFLRKAALGELAFLRLARVDRVAGRRSMVLFDAGPGQLGSPRLAHVALLLVLWRRALRDRAALSWGTLQAPGRTFDEVTPATVGALLHARTTEPVEDVHAETWARLVGGVEDLWLVGSRPALDACRMLQADHIRVEDVIEPRVARLDVEVQRRRRPPFVIGLELPDERSCVRLLRDPFEVAQSPHTTHPYSFEANPTLVIGASGGRVFVRMSNGEAVGFHVPGSRREPPGKPRRFGAVRDDYVLAIEARGRRMAMLTRRKDGLFFTSRQEQVTLPVSVDPTFVIPDRAQPLQRLHAAPERGERAFDRALVLDGMSRLFKMIHMHGGCTLMPVVDQPVSAIALRRVCFVTVPHEGAPASVVLDGAPVRGLAYDLDGDGDFAAHFGAAHGNEGHPRIGILAVRDRTARWLVDLGDTSVEIADPADAEVLGVAVTYQFPGRHVALVVIDRARRRICLRCGELEHVLVESAVPIVSASCSGEVGLVAWIDARGRLKVFSLARMATVLSTSAEPSKWQ